MFLTQRVLTVAGQVPVEGPVLRSCRRVRSDVSIDRL